MKFESHFNLTKPNFEAKVAAVIRDLREHSDYSDVTLGCSDSGRRSFQAHKFILAANSPVFKEMFQNQQKVTTPYIYLKNVPFEDLSSLLDFIYCGEVKVLESNLSEFLALAQEFQIQGLDQGLHDTAMEDKNKRRSTNSSSTQFGQSYPNMRSSQLPKYPTVKSINENMKYDNSEMFSDEEEKPDQKYFSSYLESSNKYASIKKPFIAGQMNGKYATNEDDAAQALAYQGIDLVPVSSVKEELYDEDDFEAGYKYANSIKTDGETEKRVVPEQTLWKGPDGKGLNHNISEGRKKCKICRSEKIPRDKILSSKYLCKLCSQNACHNHMVIVCQTCVKHCDTNDLVLLKTITIRRSKCHICMADFPPGFKKLMSANLTRLKYTCQACSVNVCPTHFFILCTRCVKACEKKDVQKEAIDDYNKPNQDSSKTLEHIMDDQF